MPRRRTRNDWKVVHELHRRVSGVVSRGGTSDTVANEIHGLYLRHGKLPAPASTEIPRCPNHAGTALVGNRCPIPTCEYIAPETWQTATRSDHRVTRELHQAVVGIVSRGGNLDDIATGIHNAYRRAGWKADAPSGLAVSRCQNPAGPHRMTHLVNNRCPTCGWSPLPMTDRNP